MEGSWLSIDIKGAIGKLFPILSTVQQKETLRKVL